jgi:hypothetical protein
MGEDAHQGKAKKRPASRWRCFKRKYVFFPGEGFKGVGEFKVFILWESFGFLKYTREGVRKDRLQQRVRSSSGRAGVNGRAREHAEACA